MRLLTLFLLCAAVGALLAQTAGLPQSAQRIPIEANYALFRTDGGQRSYVDISYAIPCEALTYVQSGPDSIVADVVLRINAFERDSIWAADLWRSSHRLGSSDSRRDQRMINSIRLPIHPGKHVIKLFVRDLHNEALADSVAFEVEQPQFVSDELAMSDLLVASSITPEKTPTDPAFHRNSFRVIPNPSAIFGAGTPMMFYYLEIYNLGKSLSGKTYRTKCYVAAADGSPASKPREQMKELAGESSVEVGALSVAALPSGTYDLHFDLMDAQEKILKSASRKVFVLNRRSDATGPEAAASEMNPLNALSDEQIAHEVEYIKYLLRKDEKRIVEKLSGPSAQREFLPQFWKSREAAASEPWLVVRRKYLEAIAFVNANFRTYYTEGWRTARGRVFLLYGKPDDIERFPNSDENKPYEIWTYNTIEGGVEFVFADRANVKDYELLHSTKIGEIKNENWRQLISLVR